MSKTYLKLHIQKEIEVLKKQIFKPENTQKITCVDSNTGKLN